VAAKQKTLKDKLPKIGRDSVLFFAGLAGVFHETVIAKSERPTLLFLFATMIGLPAFLRADEKKKAEGDADAK
jgi:hypothetical protein